jgi:hypothetical protein
MLTLLSATSGQAFRVSCSSSACRGKGGARFNSKPSNVRKFVTGPDHRICRSHTHSRFSELDRALDNCRGILDHLRQVDLPVALIRMLDQSAFFNGATWLSMDFMERCMKQPTGSPPLHLAGSATDKTPVPNSDERLHAVLATLEGCRSALVDHADHETAQLLSVAILQLRLKLNRISDAELKALCDAVASDDRPARRPHDPRSPRRHPRHAPAVLKLVK